MLKDVISSTTRIDALAYEQAKEKWWFFVPRKRTPSWKIVDSALAVMNYERRRIAVARMHKTPIKKIPPSTRTRSLQERLGAIDYARDKVWCIHQAPATGGFHGHELLMEIYDHLRLVRGFRRMRMTEDPGRFLRLLS